MKLNLVLGLQFGDEGKGKFVDYLSEINDYIVRSNGGNNAGHTIVINNKKYIFSILPCGSLYGKEVFIAQGCVIDPKVLLNEIDVVKETGKILKLRIDPRCHVVMPYHKILDKATENYKGKWKMGSLKLGIGYCYEDKTNRDGIRVLDILNKEKLTERVKKVWDIKKSRIIDGFKYKFDIHIKDVIEEYYAFGRKLKQYVGLVPEFLLKESSNKNILIETSQAHYLDYVFGTYPYTVGYNTIASAALAHIGLPPQEINVLGILRAYTIRVGNGPFPSEQDNEIGNKLRKNGNEYGTISKRPRRCGWLDLVLAKYACNMNGVRQIALTKIDILSGINELKICIGYQDGDKVVKDYDPTKIDLGSTNPVYETFKGWEEDITEVKNYKELPRNCKKYIEFIEQYLNVEVKYISVGPNRDQVIEH